MAETANESGYCPLHASRNTSDVTPAGCIAFGNVLILDETMEVSLAL